LPDERLERPRLQPFEQHLQRHRPHLGTDADRLQIVRDTARHRDA
jgi:hypothetical protein